MSELLQPYFEQGLTPRTRTARDVCGACGSRTAPTGCLRVVVEKRDAPRRACMEGYLELGDYVEALQLAQRDELLEIQRTRAARQQLALLVLQAVHVRRLELQLVATAADLDAPVGHPAGRLVVVTRTLEVLLEDSDLLEAMHGALDGLFAEAEEERGEEEERGREEEEERERVVGEEQGVEAEGQAAAARAVREAPALGLRALGVGVRVGALQELAHVAQRAAHGRARELQEVQVVGAGGGGRRFQAAKGHRLWCPEAQDHAYGLVTNWLEPGKWCPVLDRPRSNFAISILGCAVVLNHKNPKLQLWSNCCELQLPGSTPVDSEERNRKFCHITRRRFDSENQPN
ncbi:hypothetical protein FIBSPDRAFT_900566 [Athelia psychrophila]|uniref:Uncharacterized protein n=1 Tax=Athelia psychrophila TaxID=1759441 RepID=A0A165Y9C1_9AGAM|nr:hypothetical protein FIBSPDRAFT_900566 [Fibularhizoctonia sp. CBS 109695]